MIGLFGIRLLTAFLTIITLGFAWPAMHCMYLRWYYSNSVIGGFRLKFTGRGIGLFGRYLLWTLLTIVTLTIFGLWVPIKYNEWVLSNVEIDRVEPPRD